MKKRLNCLVCGIQFIAKRNDAKYCSLKCLSFVRYRNNIDYYRAYNKAKTYKWQKERICPQCNKIFLPGNKNQIRCSCQCVRYYKNYKKRQKLASKRYPISCKWCKTIFTPKTTIQVFCSENCQIKNYMKEKMGVKNIGYRNAKINCVNCGKLILGKKYCSKKCITQWERKNNPNKVRLRDTIHRQKRRSLKYSVGGSFTKKQWEELKEKYNFTCPKCCRKEPEIKLTVDHIIPLSKWIEWEEKNKPSYQGNSIENIKPLCLSCNSFKNNKIVD